MTGWPDSALVIQGYDGGVAYDVEDGSVSRGDRGEAMRRRAELYHHPLGFLQPGDLSDH